MRQMLLWCATFSVFTFWISAPMHGCGIDLSLPTFHFPHVDENGKLSYWDKIGEINLGDGLILPINLNFRPDRSFESRTLEVSGFMLGLTDASVVQLDEQRFRLYTPIGRYIILRRDRKNPNILHGGKKWKGEIKGDIITVVSNCGDRLTYHRGIISQMKIKDRKFDFVRSGRKVNEIREGGRSVFTISTDAQTEAVVLSFGNNQKIKLKRSERPRVEHILGSNVIGGKEKAIGEVVFADNRTRIFEYGVDRLIQPVFTVSEGGVNKAIFTWNTETNHVISENDWKYTIVPSERQGNNAAIRRIDSIGSTESWYSDLMNGVEKITEVGGASIESYIFTKGNLKGKARQRLVKDKTGRIVERITWSYGEDGKLIRKKINDLTINRVGDSIVVARGNEILYSIPSVSIPEK